LFTYIDRRNDIVHEIATRMARIVRSLVSELQQLHDQQQKHGFQPRSNDLTEWLPTANAGDDERCREVNHAKRELQDWYALLIQASNCVFQVEYWSRVLGAR
jgi:hypothetical protein